MTTLAEIREKAVAKAAEDQRRWRLRRTEPEARGCFQKDGSTPCATLATTVVS